MATSGTYGQVVFSVASITEHAFRRATGLPASAISAEDLVIARESLYLGTTALANRGLSLWCVRSVTLACEPGKAAYELPVGTEDIGMMYLRQPATRTPGALGPGSATVTFAAVTVVNNVELGLPAGTATWVIEASTDNISWAQVGSYSGTLAVPERIVIDLEPQPEVLYWRARQTVGTDTPTSAFFCQALRDTVTGRLNRDDYFSLPNKWQRGKPLQFWFDKQIRPRAVVWQVPDTQDYQLGFELQFRVQDPGDFNLSLAVPDRWLDAVIWDLAMRLYVQLPRDRVNPRLSLGELKQLADAAIRSAEDSETDGAPIRIMPGIGCYTA